MEQEYAEKIREIEKCDSLTDWEKNFIFGDEQYPPIRERESLSIKMKGIVNRIHSEKVLGKGRDEIEITYGNNRVKGVPKGKLVVAVVDGKMIGPDMRQSEAVSVIAWLSSCIDRLCPLESEGGAEEADAGFPGEE